MDIRLYYKNFLTLLSGNTISQVIPFLVAPIIGRIYSPIEMATFSNFFAIISVLGIIASGRLELAIPIVEKKDKAQDLVFSGLIFTVIVTLLSLLIPLFKEHVISFYNDDNLGNLLWLVPVSVMSYGLLLIVNNWTLRLKQFKTISVSKVIQATSNHGISVLMGFAKTGAIGLITGWLVSQFVAIAILTSKINRKINRKKEDFNTALFKSTVSEFRDFPLINSMHAFMDVFATQFLLFWIITISFGKWELGIYAMMFKYIRGPIGLITSSLSQLFYVEAGNAMNNKQPISHIFNRTIKITLFFAVAFSAVLLLFGQELFALYLGEKWRIGGVYAQCILPVLFFTFIVSPVSGLTILFRKQFVGFILSLLCYGFSILGFVLSIYFKWTFEEALLIYSGVFTLYYITVLIWYKSMIRKYEHAILN